MFPGDLTHLGSPHPCICSHGLHGVSRGLSSHKVVHRVCFLGGGFSSLEQFTAGKREFHSPWSTEKNAKCEPQEKHSLGSGVGAEQQVTGPGAP